MRSSLCILVGLGWLSFIACSGAGGEGEASGTGGADGSAGFSTGGTGAQSSAGAAGVDSSVGGAGGSDASSETVTTSDSGGFPPAGNPDGSCKSMQLPTEAQLVNTSKPTSVVGTGTPASCTFEALSAAVSKGGIITFNCGTSPVTIPVTATLTPPTSNAYAKEPSVNTVVDGGNLVTLDGQNAVRIMSWIHAGSWRINQDTLTLQRIRFINGKTTPTEAIPPCPPSGNITNAECSTGFNDGQGGALNMRDGNLRVIDCIFEHNQAALLGPDTGGGAIYVLGTADPAYIVHSTFRNNTASNAGGVGMLWSGAFVFNCLFEGNSAVGTGANSVDATKCTCSNGGNQNQIGSGGNGGAVYKDGGDSVDVTICGTQIRGNTANEFGPAAFLTANGSSAKLVLVDSLLTGNSTPIPYWQWCIGVSTDNPHQPGCSTCSPGPVDTTFCDANGANCQTTCSS